jgi:hypothetical protein
VFELERLRRSTIGRQIQKEKNMKLEKGMLVISLRLKRPRLSASGKSFVVGSTRGLKKSAVKIGGRPVHFIANAFIKRETRRSSTKKNKKLKALRKT